MRGIGLTLIAAACVSLAACSKANNNGQGSMTSQLPGNGVGATGGMSGALPGVGGSNVLPGSGGGGGGGSAVMPAGSGGTGGGTGGGSAVAGAGGAAVSPGTGGTGGTAAGTGGEGTAGSSGGGMPPPDVMGCGDTKLYQVPDDPGAPGPWPVGVKTLQVAIAGGSIPVEVWYPAPFGSGAGQTREVYDPSSWIGSASERMKIPEADKTPESCDCYRDLPVDTTHGPYPAVIFIHGTGSFRVASLSTMTQWASRGFVVAAADHPGMFLTDYLADGVISPGHRHQPGREPRRGRDAGRDDGEERRLRLPGRLARHDPHRHERA